MSNNITNIRQRENGLWEGRVCIAGKRRSVYGNTKKEVKDRLISMMNAANEGTFVDESSVTVSTWMKEYLKDYTADLKDATMSAYDDIIHCHIIPALGSIKLKDLSPVHVQKFYRSLSGKGLSPKTVRNIHGVLHEALDKAIRMDMLKRNVSQYCDLPKKRKKEMHPLSDVQLAKFLAIAKATDEDYYPIFFVAFFTGLRQCELIGLTWDCINFERETLRVYRQYCRIDYGDRVGEYDFAPLKNDKERTFGVAHQVIAMLKQIKIRQAEQKLSGSLTYGNRQGFVFTRSDGRPISASTMYHHFKRIVTEMGLPEVRFHDARHTYATLALQNGVDIKTLSMALGHATTSFTLDVYGHVSDHMQEDMATKMNRFIATL